MTVTLSTEMFHYNMDTGEIFVDNEHIWVGEDENRQEFVLYPSNPDDLSVWTLLILSYRTYNLTNPAAIYIDGTLPYVTTRLSAHMRQAQALALPTRFEIKPKGW